MLVILIHTALRMFIFVIHFVSQIFVIICFYKAYKKTKSTTNLLFTLSFITFLLGYMISYIPHSLPKEERYYNTVSLLFIVTNIFIWLGILIFTNAYLYILKNKITLISHVPAIITGFILAIIADPTKISLKVNETFDVWVPQYSFTHIYFHILLFIILLWTVIHVYYLKLVQVKKQNKFDISFFAILLFLFWLISVFFDSMRVLRFVLLPLSIFLFGIAVNKNPLVLLITKSQLHRLYLFTEYQMPFYGYDFINKQISLTLSSTEILNATKTAYSESLNLSEKEVDTIRTITQDIVTMKYKKTKILIIGKDIDENIKSAIIYALNLLPNIIEKKKMLISPVLSDKKVTLITKIFKVLLSDVLFMA